MTRTSWICRTDFERERFLDLHRRMLPVNSYLLVLAAVLVVPFHQTAENSAGLVPVAFAIALFGIGQRLATRLARPEVWIFAALLATEASMGAATVIGGVQHSGALAMLCWPAVGACARFRALPAIVATAFAAVVILVSSLAFDGSAAIEHPLGVTTVLAALVSVTTVCMALRRSDVEHRGAASLDPLTGLLSRNALARRVEEIEEQSKLSGEPVGVIVADLDHFKSVNDVHGHAAGDAVLREVGGVFRREMRAYDFAYRLGGEEVAVVMAGADLADATARAEQLRAAIAREPLADLAVTASFGVAASEPGRPFAWSEAFERADAALYEAKGAGRNRVASSPSPVVAHS